ncbi:hypothetical protein Rhopal_002428-T1 [Rhodotorula paludigena]|uniref:Protein LTV1 n=1 Tax=Rhodotorula paludigena TaxID=86838 RepID=A0AAV5GJB4_9BASI|nr:hypothetical protein Rhopal_002428-T1 [Rhodotorula paludigena]
MAPSLWRRPGTKTFQLVHRSQRDPLINDPTASDRVLKAVDKRQKRKGDGATSYAASEFTGFDADEAEDAAAAAGDAAAYGIFYEDADSYDYMQHLRQVGTAGESYLVEAPVQNKQQKGAANKRNGGFELSEAALDRQNARHDGAFEMPEDALPSHPLDEVSYDSIMASKAPERGLQPDLDPSIREVLEALDDDAYAADDGTNTDEEDEFWGGVISGGQVGDASEQFWEDDEDAEEDATAGVVKGVRELALEGQGEDEPEGSWAAFKAFKAAGGAAAAGASDDEDDFASEGGDTIADLRATLANRPARRAATAAGSAFSMSSSAMVEKLYDESDDDSWGGSDYDSDEAASRVPQGAARADLEKIMDDFLSKYEVIGGKYREALQPLQGGTGATDASLAANASRLDRLRAEMAALDLGEAEEGEDPEMAARRREKERILAIVERQWKEENSRNKKERAPKITILEDERRDRWDCETVLSTYSNLSNHPRMLRLRDVRGPKPAQIKLDPKTGFPMVDGQAVLDARPNRRKGKEQEDTIMEEEDEKDDEEDEEDYALRETVKRPRDETAEDKKARKAAVKAERAARRQEKKTTKDAFSTEVKRQKRISGRRVADGAAADIRSGQDGVRRLA